MWIEEMKIPIRQVASGRLEEVDGWGFVEMSLAGIPRKLYFHFVELTIDIPCCNRQIPRGAHRCILPPGHESADIPCLGAKSSVPDLFQRIVQVTDRHPCLGVPREDQEASCED